MTDFAGTVVGMEPVVLGPGGPVGPGVFGEFYVIVLSRGPGVIRVFYPRTATAGGFILNDEQDLEATLTPLAFALGLEPGEIPEIPPPPEEPEPEAGLAFIHVLVLEAPTGP